MGAPDLLNMLQGMGLQLSVQGSQIHVRPRDAITDEARRLIREYKAELLDALQRAQGAPGQQGGVWVDERKRRALAFLEANPQVKRACFADVQSDPANVILTVAVRDPRAAVEVLIDRAKFDAMRLLELSLRYPDTSLFVQEH